MDALVVQPTKVLVVRCRVWREAHQAVRWRVVTEDCATTLVAVRLGYEHADLDAVKKPTDTILC